MQIIQKPDQFDNTNKSPFYIYSKYIIISPDYRNISYSINITSQDRFKSKPYSINITELPFPHVQATQSNIDVITGYLNSNTVSIPLDNYFIPTVLPISYLVDYSYSTNNIYTIQEPYMPSHNSPNIPTLSKTLTVQPFFENYPTLLDEHYIAPININIFQSPQYTYNSIQYHNISNIPISIDLTQFDILPYIIFDYTKINLQFNTNKDLRDNFLSPHLPLYNLNTSNLTIYPDYRDTQYSIQIISQYDTSYAESNIYDIHISESTPNKPIHSEFYIFTEDIVFKNKNRSFDLSLFFKETNHSHIYNSNTLKPLYFQSSIIAYSTYTYDIESKSYTEIKQPIENIPENIFFLDNSNITITPYYRFISYIVQIDAFDPYYHTKCDIPIHITVNEDRPLKLDLNNIIPDIYGLTDSILIFNLNDYIINPFNTPLSFSSSSPTTLRQSLQTSNPPFTLLNNILTIEGDYRNTNYTINVNIVNPQYPNFPADMKIQIQEISAPPPYPINNSFEYPTHLTINTISYNLDQLFNSDITSAPFNYILQTDTNSQKF